MDPSAHPQQMKVVQHLICVEVDLGTIPCCTCPSRHCPFPPKLLGIERWHIKLVSTVDKSPSPSTCGRVGWGCCIPDLTCASGWRSQPKFLSWLSGRRGRWPIRQDDSTLWGHSWLQRPVPHQLRGGHRHVKRPILSLAGHSGSCGVW